MNYSTKSLLTSSASTTPLFSIDTLSTLTRFHVHPSAARCPVFMNPITSPKSTRLSIARASVPAVVSDVSADRSRSTTHDHSPHQGKMEQLEVTIEKVVYRCRFFAILAVCGSLVGSLLCFIKGSVYVVSAFQDYFLDRGTTTVISSLVEATDVYLLGTVMLVFGMGLYELFISNLDKVKSSTLDGAMTRSNLFGLFILKERPRWLEIKTVNELKTKLGHVIVMLLLIGLFDKSKKAVIQTPLDLLCFAASVLLSSGCLFLLSKLNE